MDYFEGLAKNVSLWVGSFQPFPLVFLPYGGKHNAKSITPAAVARQVRIVSRLFEEEQMIVQILTTSGRPPLVILKFFPLVRKETTFLFSFKKPHN